MRLALGASLICVFAVGCASKYEPPAGTSPEVSREVRANYDAVWTACVESFATRTIGIKTIEKSSGIIAAENPVNVGASAAYVDLGRIDDVPVTEPNRSDIRVTGARCTYNVFVRTLAPDKHLVRMNTQWEAGIVVYDGWKGIWVPLGVTAVSTGKFENEFLDDIVRRVQ